MADEGTHDTVEGNKALENVLFEIAANQQTIMDQNKSILQNLLDGQGENNNSFTDILNWINKEK
tara:strand:- start:569 stop:760 length:192 start_codon:yes stop_codon:yes gene_type:complete